MKFIFPLLVLFISGCISTDWYTPPLKSENYSIDPQITPPLAELDYVSWKGRKLTDLFNDIYSKGIPSTDCVNEIFIPDENLWEIIRADNVMIVSIKVPSFKAAEDTIAYKISYLNWKRKFDFPVEEARFIINPFTRDGDDYVKDQVFKDHLLFAGLTDYTLINEYGSSVTNRSLYFYTQNGIEDLKDIRIIKGD